MSKEEALFDRVHKYLSEELTVEERELFDHDLQKDSALRQELEHQESLKNIVVRGELLVLKDQMSAMDFEKEFNGHGRKHTWKIISGIVLLGALGALLLVDFSPEEQAQKPSALPKKPQQRIVQEKIGQSQIDLAEVKSPDEKVNRRSVINGESQPVSQKVNSIKLEESVEDRDVNETEQVGIDQKDSESQREKPTQADEQIVSEKAKTSALEPCGSSQITSLQVNYKASCEFESNGQVSISDIKSIGMTPPFQYVLSETLPSKQSVIENLSAGIYSLTLIDSKKCRVDWKDELVVPQTECEEANQQDVRAFNPNEESWVVPTDQNREGRVQIISNVTGQIVLDRVFNVGEELVWKGDNQTSQRFSEGEHTFLINYSDGSTKQGTINVIVY